MENTIEIQKQSIRTLNNAPQYFGLYLNMARLNIFNISNYLAEKFGLAVLDEEEKITISFLGDKGNKEYKTKQSYIYFNLIKYMPVAKVFDFEKLPKNEIDKTKNNSGKDFNKLSDTLKVIFKELNEFRNDYSHYFSTEKQDKRKLKISSELKDFLNINFSRALSYTKNRLKDVFSDDDFNIASQTVVVNNDNTITQDGIVFLISMFLDMENAFQFINKIIGLKGTQTKAFKAKREVLMTFCVKLPHDKFVSENPQQTFSLELINELNKCPKLLYNVITEEEKQIFKPQIQTEQIENIISNSVPDTIDDYENYIESITKKVRYENRFSYFALKYIDLKELFKKWRFQIDLGKVVLDKYSKQLNGKDEVRTVTENAKAFGRLQDFYDQEKILNKINIGENKTRFYQFAPHYNFDVQNNKIGISKKETTAKFISKNTTHKVKFNLLQPLPEVFLSIHELPKIILLEYLEQGKTEKLINNFIKLSNSTILNKKFIETIKYKLSDLDVFHKRSMGRKEISAYRKDILKYLIARKEKLNQILSEHNLSVKQIPTRILDYWLNIADVQEKTAISDRIKLMKRDCMDRLKAIKKNNAPKIGEMATFLAKDIVDMLISEGKKKKITSFYYDKMQECLVLFADKEKKELFISICSELKLNDADGHPFLKNINLSDIRYTSDLYKIYLQEKADNRNQRNRTDTSWLAKNFYTLKNVEVFDKKQQRKIFKLQTIVELPQDKSKIPFTIRQLEKEKSSFNKWLEYITKGKETTDKKKPVNLPANLFDDTLKKLLKTELSKNNIQYNKEANYNQLFKIWWKEFRKDNTQNFYTAEREYTFEEEKLNFKINTQPKFENYYTRFAENVFNKKQALRNEERKTKRNLPPIQKIHVIKKIRNKIGNTEKEIRMLQEEDRLMLLMFEKLTKENLNLKLEKVNELLNERIEIKEKIPGKLSFDDLGEKTITRNIVETRKRKEYSVLQKYIFDRRLPELFEYFNETDILIEKIKTELDAYNKAKDIVFDLIFKLEEAIIKKDETGIKELNKDQNGNIQTGNIQHKPYLHWLLKKNMITEKEFTFINMVRNTFSHNRFPQKKTMELFIKKWNDNNFAYQILETYKQKTNNIIEKLKDM
ncbi:MAG: hypothetical protein COX07_04460 [Bacteroidetes bacterium CG23_combo_of_CG06-09_8_20_14_all_32_9]|nr:MAG: hypothetical protein COX07_04460 [Bacteroidetes bacterium CG23_combo_of_CG06-09_8_20_14_all_32_9]